MAPRLPQNRQVRLGQAHVLPRVDARAGVEPRIRVEGDRAGTCVDPAVQIVQGRTVCVVSCQRSREPVFLKWKGMEASPEGNLYVRNGPGSVRLAPDSARQYIRMRFGPGG